MVLDFALIIIVALFIYIGYKRGIVKALYGFASLAVSGVASFFLSRWAAGGIYKMFFRSAVNKSIAQSIQTAGEASSNSIEDIFSALPSGVKGLLDIFKIETNVILENTQSLQTDIQNSVMDVVVSIISFILFILFFIAIFVLLKVLSKSILAIFDFPVIKQVNGVFGAVFGLAEGLVICYIAVVACRLLPDVNHSLVSSGMIEKSVIFGRIYFSEFISLIADNFCL